MLRTRLTIICASFVLCSLSAVAHAVTLTFDEVPFQSVNGLTVNGVTFGFEVGGAPSSDAFYNAFGPGPGTTSPLINDPVLEGDVAGVLSLTLAKPANRFRFAAALSDFGALTPGFTVELFSPANLSLGIFSVDTNPLVVFSEAQFGYFGDFVQRAVIDFNDAATGPGRFLIDQVSATVPEPISLALLGIGLAALSSTRRGHLASRKRNSGEL